MCNKVYCTNCKLFSGGYYDGCSYHSEYCKIEGQGNYRNKTYSDPSLKNKNNDCKDFQQIEPFSFVKLLKRIFKCD